MVRTFPGAEPGLQVEGGLALKEWAVALRALDRGEQIVLLRKGGIVEETKEFRVAGTDFFFYPTYEHQRKELVKPSWHADLEDTVRGMELPPKRVRITHGARVVEDVELLDETKLRRIDGFHIWAPDYAAERLHWKPKKPLHVLVLRVFRLSRPAEIPVCDRYLGCKSWVRLEEPVPAEGEPVLSDEAFARKVEELHRALEISTQG
ncbi:MAG: DUF1802 family protein [Alicyclobacillaceae bacterium]|nr:DUF1802 family protein [Alicyclobacillaceae bacterium]